MTRLYHHLRLPWIALAAIVGLLSVAGESAACEAKSTPKAARSCCASRSSSDCGGCCGFVEDSSRPAANGRSVAAAAEVGLAVPQRQCECRSGGPAAPAPKPESRPAQTRPDRDRDTDVAFFIEDSAAVTFAPLTPRPSGSPKTPLYLRTSRLLI